MLEAAKELREDHGINDVDMCIAEMDEDLCFGDLGTFAGFDDLKNHILQTVADDFEEEKQIMRNALNMPVDEADDNSDIGHIEKQHIIDKLKSAKEDNDAMRKAEGLGIAKRIPRFWNERGQSHLAVSVAWDYKDDSAVKTAWVLRPFGCVVGKGEGLDFISDHVQHKRKTNGEIHNIEMLNWVALDWVPSGVLFKSKDNIHATQFATDLYEGPIQSQIHAEELQAEMSKAKKEREARATNETAVAPQPATFDTDPATGHIIEGGGASK